MTNVTLPTDLLLNLLAEAEHHTAARAPGILGPYRPTAADVVRAYLAGGLDALLVIVGAQEVGVEATR